ncbi:hypothetical protein QL285_046354 [Trifolium repens]|nr:hypothetical protein QL285_046354 [Trifolium repens]
MRRRRKFNVVHHGDPSLEKDQSIDSSNEVNKEGSETKTRGYTHMLDVWDMPDGEFILVEVDTLGNPMGWKGKTLLNAIGSLGGKTKLAYFAGGKDLLTLKSKGYDESKTEEEMATNVPDKRVDPSQYPALVHRWCSKKGKVVMSLAKLLVAE